jgi:hypothetical protein
MPPFIRGVVAGLILTAAFDSPGFAQATTAPAVARDEGWLQWRRLPTLEKERVIAGTVTGIEAGWLWAYGQAQGDIAKVLFAEKDAGRLTDTTITAVTRNRITDPPRFSRMMSFYREAIDGAYERSAEARATGLAELLLCFSDTPVRTCKLGQRS